MEATAQMKGLVEYIARELVEKPEGVSVTEVEQEDGVHLELRVADGDLGRVIGREGRVAKAIRTLLQAGSAAHKERRYVLDIIEENPRPGRNRSKNTPDEENDSF